MIGDAVSNDLISRELEESNAAHGLLTSDSNLRQQLNEWAARCATCLLHGGIIFFAGNGGSFADAQHLAAELTGKMGIDRAPLSGIVLGANGSSISAVGNDFGFEEVFAREFVGLYKPHSVVLGFSTSGNSQNVILLAKAARKKDVPVAVFTGISGGDVADVCEVIRVPSNRTERIQEMHILLGHILCLLIEEHLGVKHPETTV